MSPPCHRHVTATSPPRHRHVTAVSPQACGPLVVWVSSQLEYLSMLEKVKPLRRAVSRLEGSAGTLAEKCDAAEASMAALGQSIAALQGEYAALMGEVAQVKESRAMCNGHV